MPNTKHTAGKSAPKPQPSHDAPPQPIPGQQEEIGAPAPNEPKPIRPVAPVDTALFDADPGEPSAVAGEGNGTAASSEQPVDDRPEGIGGAEAGEKPVTDPVLAVTTEQEQIIAPPPPEEPLAPSVKDATLEMASKVSIVEPSSVEPIVVRLGQAKGLLHRMPLSEVLAYAEKFAGKLAALIGTQANRDLQKRMRVTEGRCAPVYFTGDDDGEPEHLLAGDDALAAAIAVEIETVSVIVVRSEDAGAAQAYISGMAGTSRAGSTEEDDLVWRTAGYNAES